MTLDLGHLREFMHRASGGDIHEMPISKELAASCQALMICFATISRFYTNEGRDGKACTVIIFVGCYLIACALFVIICWALLSGLPSTDVVAYEPTLQNDIVALQILCLVWVGYPCVSVIARVMHIGAKQDEYSATVSFVKVCTLHFTLLT